jgi:pseudaminic acid biosynthesis-associated methylase
MQTLVSFIEPQNGIYSLPLERKLILQYKSSKQEIFWRDIYAEEYIIRNNNFDLDLGIKAWAQMTRKLVLVKSILECGCNIGRNINFLNYLMPEADKSIVEISPVAFKLVSEKYSLVDALNCSIRSSDFNGKQFDLVFTSGVLIHIPPEDLLENLSKIYSLSKKYILFCEMFSRTPRTVRYKGEDDLLFTRDYGRFFLDNFKGKVIDYGFLWGHFFDDAGFDDGHYWVFEKIAD